MENFHTTYRFIGLFRNPELFRSEEKDTVCYSPNDKASRPRRIICLLLLDKFSPKEYKNTDFKMSVNIANDRTSLFRPLEWSP